MEILQAMPSLRDATRTADFAYAFLTNHKDTKEEQKSRSHGEDFAGDRLS
ncbi:hypothetical protein [Nostoc sp.]